MMEFFVVFVTGFLIGLLIGAGAILHRFYG